MSKQAADKVVILGCGNVAWHLAKQLVSLRFHVTVYNHRANKALRDFTALGCRTEAGLSAVAGDAAFYFVCVADGAIGKASKHIVCRRKEAVVMHTSGSAAVSELKNTGGHKAVFYPLQTFSKEDRLSWKEIPIAIEAAHAATAAKLAQLARSFTDKVSFPKREQRLQLHLAAVLVNNFPNALYAAAADLAGSKNFDLLLPLIRQTTAKLDRLTPIAAQTGPARRGDKGVMKKHLRLLEEQHNLKKIYRQLSRLIIQQQHAHA